MLAPNAIAPDHRLYAGILSSRPVGRKLPDPSCRVAAIRGKAPLRLKMDADAAVSTAPDLSENVNSLPSAGVDWITRAFGDGQFAHCRIATE